MSEKSIRVYINGSEYECQNVNEAFALSVETIMPHIKYMSDENIKKWLKDIWAMIYDENDGLGMRIYGATKTFNEYLDKTYLNGQILVNYVFELILRKEGLAVGKEVFVNRHGGLVR